jgi:hypothetical protein
VADAAVVGIADGERRRIILAPAAAVQLEHLFGGKGRPAECTGDIGIVDASFDRGEIPFLGRPQADNAVAERWVRDRERHQALTMLAKARSC